MEIYGWPATEVFQIWYIPYSDNEVLSVFLTGNLNTLGFLSKVGVTMFVNKIAVAANAY